LARLAPLSFGVYLLHPLWLFVLLRAGLAPALVPPLWGIPVLSLLVFVLSAASVVLVRLGLQRLGLRPAWI
jgi:peptidoglycan/LPS O-acetylase OafA/YrhL